MNIFRIILALLILFIPLYPKFPLLSVQNTYVAFRLDDIVVLSAIAIWLIYQIKHRFPIFKQKNFYIILPYAIAILVTTLTSLFIFQTDPKNILFLHLFRRLEYISLLFIAVLAIKSPSDLKFPYYFLMVSLIGVCIYGFGQKYWSFPVISTMNAEFSKGQLLEMNVWSRISSTFAGHYDLAAYLSIVLIIIFCAGFFTKNLILKTLNLIIWLVGFQVLTLTAARISIFAFWGGITLALILIRKYLWIIPISALVLYSFFSSKDLNQRLMATIPTVKLFLNRFHLTGPSRPQPTLTPTPTLAPVAIVPITPGPIIPGKLATPTPTIIRHRPEDETQLIDADLGVARSGEIRFKVEWPRALRAFKKNPISGTGLGSITLATDNDYLRALGESGLFGFLTFGSIFFFYFFHTVPFIFKRHQTPLQQINLIFLACLLCTLANAMFIDVFEASKFAYTFWIMMGIYYQTLSFKSDVKY